jgi:hypothetical protein
MFSTEMKSNNNNYNRIYLEMNSSKDEDIMFVLQVSSERFIKLKQMSKNNISKLLHFKRIGCNLNDPNTDFILASLMEDDD